MDLLWSPIISDDRAYRVPYHVAQEQLLKLSLGEGSTLHTIATWIGEGWVVQGWVTMATIPGSGKIVGWAWADEEQLHVFVDPQCRWRGIGRALVRELRACSDLSDVAHHDDLSRAFWSALGIPSRFFPDDDWLIWCALALPEPEELPLHV